MEPFERPNDVPATAGVIARPIIFFPAAVLASLVLDRLLPLPASIPLEGWMAWTFGSLLVLTGLAFFAAGVRNFSRAETPLPTNQPALVLVTTGIYQWTRNPIYLSFFLMYVGIGLVAGSPWAFTFLPPLFIFIRYGVIAREEEYLERRFGNAYIDYKLRVRRWLSLWPSTDSKHIGG